MKRGYPGAVLAVTLLCCAVARADGLGTLVAPEAQALVLGTGYGFCEGPAADAAGNVYFSDGQKNSIHLYKPGHTVEVFVDDSLDANGMMFNQDGELVVCEGAAYQIVAFDVKTKQARVLVGGGPREYNEPNDLCIDGQGGIYFTDPNYKHRGQEAMRKENAYYRAPDGTVTTVSDVCTRPNGILLSADFKTLYLADNAGKALYKYDVVGPGKLANETKWLDLGAGPDGMTLDTQGNLYIACGRAGVLVYSAQGEKLGVIGPGHNVPHASNVCFGGPDFSVLYMTSRDKFLGLKTKVRGVKPLPAR